MSVVIVSSIVLDPGSTPGISTILKMTTRLSRVILWGDGFSFSPCIQRVSGVLTSFRNLSPATRFSPFFPRSFSVWAGILCFLRTGSDTSPIADILSEQAFSQMTVFWGCVKTSNDLKNHPFSQTKSRSQVSGSDIYSDFQRSVLLGKVFFARLPNIFALRRI